eukprot:6180015-Pleurochrysis_carterae.AAC.4
MGIGILVDMDSNGPSIPVALLQHPSVRGTERQWLSEEIGHIIGDLYGGDGDLQRLHALTDKEVSPIYVFGAGRRDAPGCARGQWWTCCPWTARWVARV